MFLKAIALAFVVVVSAANSGCSTGQSTPTVDAASLQRKAFELKSIYAGALSGAIVYLEQPRCTEPRTVVLCSSQAVADDMVRYRDMAKIGVDLAESSTRSMTGNVPAMQAAVDGAAAAVNGFKQLVLVYQGGK